MNTLIGQLAGPNAVAQVTVTEMSIIYMKPLSLMGSFVALETGSWQIDVHSMVAGAGLEFPIEIWLLDNDQAVLTAIIGEKLVAPFRAIAADVRCKHPDEDIPRFFSTHVWRETSRELVQSGRDANYRDRAPIALAFCITDFIVSELCAGGAK